MQCRAITLTYDIEASGSRWPGGFMVSVFVFVVVFVVVFVGVGYWLCKCNISSVESKCTHTYA
jgi:hypothetical protein